MMLRQVRKILGSVCVRSSQSYELREYPFSFFLNLWVCVCGCGAGRVWQTATLWDCGTVRLGGGDE